MNMMLPSPAEAVEYIQDLYAVMAETAAREARQFDKVVLQNLQRELDSLIAEITSSNDELFSAKLIGQSPPLDFQDWERWMQKFTDLLRTLAQMKGFHTDDIEHAGYRTLLSLLMFDRQIEQQARAELQS